jgi:hypothetical protein
MKDYLSIEKGITEIINKLNKLKKTAKDVCINIYSKKNKPKKTRKRIKLKKDNTQNVSKGNQYSNIYTSPKTNSPVVSSSTSINTSLESKIKTNKTKEPNTTMSELNMSESLDNDSESVGSIDSVESSTSATPTSTSSPSSKPIITKK